MSPYTQATANAMNCYLNMLDTKLKTAVKAAINIPDREIFLSLYTDARIEAMTEFIDLYKE